MQRKWLPLMEINFIETNPDSREGGHGGDGAARTCSVCRSCRRRTENLAKIRTVLESLAILERAHVANRS